MHRRHVIVYLHEWFIAHLKKQEDGDLALAWGDGVGLGGHVPAQQQALQALAALPEPCGVVHHAQPAARELLQHVPRRALAAQRVQRGEEGDGEGARRRGLARGDAGDLRGRRGLAQGKHGVHLLHQDHEALILVVHATTAVAAAAAAAAAGAAARGGAAARPGSPLAAG